jgi:serine/threonine protein kinase
MFTMSQSRFNLREGSRLGTKFRVLEKLGAGVESEVYLVEDTLTKAHRAAKIFFPEMNPQDRAVRSYARKLNRLSGCPALVQYVGHEQAFLNGGLVTVLLSDLVAGEPLADFLTRQPKKRLEPFAALHLFSAIANAVATVHRFGEYHGDIHDENVMVLRRGLDFSIRLLDPMTLGRRTRKIVEDDVVELVRLFPILVGGEKTLKKLAAPFSTVFGSMRKDRILRRFATPKQVADAIRVIEWP